MDILQSVTKPSIYLENEGFISIPGLTDNSLSGIGLETNLYLSVFIILILLNLAGRWFIFFIIFLRIMDIHHGVNMPRTCFNFCNHSNQGINLIGNTSLIRKIGTMECARFNFLDMQSVIFNIYNHLINLYDVPKMMTSTLIIDWSMDWAWTFPYHLLSAAF